MSISQGDLVMKSTLNDKHFHDEKAAYDFVEARLWPNGPVCPHCGGVDRISKMQGKSTRIGTYKCYQCRGKFTVKVGTVFEDSHVPMRLWLQAVYLLSSSKKGISSNQLHRTLGVTLKTAWFMAHRIREAMRTVGMEPMGGAGEIVEADETLMGKKEDSIKRRGHGHKNAVLSLVDRNSGQVRSCAADIIPIIKANVAKETAMMTDEGGHYFTLGDHFASHESVSHKADEYVRGEGTPVAFRHSCTS